MNLKIGNYYGSFEIATFDGVKRARNVRIHKLEKDLCMGGYVYGKWLYFKTPQEAHDYIRKENPKQKFKWKFTDKWCHECEIVDDQDCDRLTPVWECATYQGLNGTDYLIDVANA